MLGFINKYPSLTGIVTLNDGNGTKISKGIVQCKTLSSKNSIITNNNACNNSLVGGILSVGSNITGGNLKTRTLTVLEDVVINGTINGQLYLGTDVNLTVTSETPSESYTTGAVTITGDLGVGGNISCNGDFSSNGGKVYLNSETGSVKINLGALSSNNNISTTYSSGIQFQSNGEWSFLNGTKRKFRVRFCSSNRIITFI